MKKQLRIATVFSGIGAPEAALKQLGVDYKIVFACDNGERYLKQSYEDIIKATKGFSAAKREEYVNQLYLDTGKSNFVKQSYFANYDITEDKWHEDIRFVKGRKYRGRVDVLVGGSPCQSFSTYGKKRGLKDTRGTLFYDYARLIKEIQPKIFIYENVTGLLTHDHKRTWQIMKEVWESLGYTLRFQVLNASDYNHPQLRKRLFLVGFHASINVENFSFPEPMELTKKSTDFLEENVSNEYYLGQKGFEWVTNPQKNLRRSRVNQDIIGCQTANQQDNWIGDFRVETPKKRHLEDPRIYKGVFENKPAVARKMTPRECLRLMGFEDFKIVVPDKIAYRQSGNSIVVPVLSALFNKLLPLII